MITVPQSMRAMPRWTRDEAGRAWLDELPQLVAEQCRTWDVEVDGAPLHGSNAIVVPVARGGAVFALRLAPPGDDVTRQVEALRFWDGRGVVELIEADPAHRAMLLERLDGARTLLSVPLDEAHQVIAGLVRTLAVPAPPDAPTTAEVARQHAESFERDWIALAEPVVPQQLRAAVDHALALAAAPVADTAVDADLHHGQVLAGTRAPWIMVDPVLLRGDPEYDLARVLWTRLDEMPGDDDVTAAFRAFVATVDVPEDRARAWVVVRSFSYLLWGLSHGMTEDPMRCRRLLDIFA
ncbi:streptomycin 6-kinase [Microbacterium kyungheense]|uniref:Streptomycin 6-kinase n=2 Tax=Microbacterium kyungheense TaxID=1263636 RepID=A0A543FJY9_9MICO|nr:streptomycin 6-kinase [Microbacterium kyungheense]